MVVVPYMTDPTITVPFFIELTIKTVLQYFFLPYSVAGACLGYHRKWKVQREFTLFSEYSLPLLNTMSVVNMLPWQEKNFSLQIN